MIGIRNAVVWQRVGCGIQGSALRYSRRIHAPSTLPIQASLQNEAKSIERSRLVQTTSRPISSSSISSQESKQSKSDVSSNNASIKAQNTAKDARPFRKKYPPIQPLPEMESFDQPAVANPIETALAHKRFRKQAQIAAYVLGALGLAGATIYFTFTVGKADDGKDLVLDRKDLSNATHQHVTVKNMAITHEELEKQIREAQKGQNQGSYTVLAIKRSATIGKAVILCMWDYRQTLNKKYKDRAEEQEELRQCHLRSAHRVLAALQENGGLYIKLGQHLSSIILLPPEWTNTMKPLQDQNTPTPLPEMEAMFRSETGRTFSEAFSEIDAKPIGVASLAQVHRAVDRQTGQQLAIKLMHPQVERFSQVDMQTVNVLVRWVKRAFPDFEFTWLAEEMNENMPLEMDFRHEAGNSRRATEDFAQYKKTSVYIPKVPWVYKRVMAMEFVDGRRPDDLQYLSDHHIDRNRVSQELSRAFSQMLYMHGFFHADPHGGNVLIRPAPKGSRSPFNFEVVLLDHGLYFDISQELRTNYARFWLALLSKSTPKVMAERRRLAKSIANIDGDLYHILESAITGRSGLEGSDDKNPNGVGGGKRKSSLLDLDSGSEMTDEEQEHIRKTVMEKEGLFIDILKVLRQVPRRMLMVLKLNDLARSLDANLHTTHGHARPFIITARYCALAVWKDDRQSLGERWQKEGLSFRLLGDWISSWANYIYFYRGLSFFEALSDMNASRRKIFSFSSAFAKSANLLGARRAMSGVDSQMLSRQKEQADMDRAREQIKVQDDDARAEAKTKKL